ncbi:MAG: 50S ribosomal protein L7/L12 [Candidatus Paceibacterota bacterium]
MSKFNSFLTELEGASVLELNELVKAIEEKFGVSAAAVSAAPAAAAVEEERATYNVELTEVGPNKIAVIKIVKEVLALGLAEAKGAVDSAPKVLKEGVKKEEAEKMKKDLEAAGAKVTLK